MQNFEQTGLKPEIIKSITEIGFETPTLIQEKTIPHLLNSTKDLIALAQTGSGKTAAFGLPVINQVNAQSKKIQALILCPTRELAIQIAKDFESYTKYTTKLATLPVYGGASIDTQIKALKKGVHIVIGTPGRVVDLIKRNKLDFSALQWVILDEADEMLNMGFKDDLDFILSHTPDQRQTLLFSATMPKEVARIAENYMNKPEEISSGKKNQGADSVEHHFYTVNNRNKYLALKRIADINPEIFGIIFCRTRRETKEIADQLIADGYNADALHGDLSQAQRDAVMNRYRNRHLQLLVATDVAARGLDVNNVTHVINYNIPDELETYTHRSGRTGRAGKKGVSIAIISPKDVQKIKKLEKTIGKTFVKKEIPSGIEVCEKQLFSFIDKVQKSYVDSKEYSRFEGAVNEMLSGLSKEELIKKFVSLELNRLLEYYKDSSDINAQAGKDRKERSGRSEGEYSRLFLNLGKKDQLNSGTLLGFMNNLDEIPDNLDVGEIDIHNNFTFIDIESKYEKQVLSALNDSAFDGRDVVAEPKTGKGKSGGKKPQGKRGKKRNSGFDKSRRKRRYKS